MIALGYPGELSTDGLTRNVFGLLSTVPFLYILYVLFVELTRSLDRQPAAVRTTVSRLRILLVATWGVYPIAYLLPLLGFDGATAWVGKQAGYSVADILAKALYGLLIFKIARLKSFADDPTFAAVEGSHEEARDTTLDAGPTPRRAGRPGLTPLARPVEGALTPGSSPRGGGGKARRIRGARTARTALRLRHEQRSIKSTASCPCRRLERKELRCPASQIWRYVSTSIRTTPESCASNSYRQGIHAVAELVGCAEPLLSRP